MELLEESFSLLCSISLRFSFLPLLLVVFVFWLARMHLANMSTNSSMWSKESVAQAALKLPIVSITPHQSFLTLPCLVPSLPSIVRSMVLFMNNCYDFFQGTHGWQLGFPELQCGHKLHWLFFFLLAIKSLQVSAVLLDKEILDYLFPRFLDLFKVVYTFLEHFSL